MTSKEKVVEYETDLNAADVEIGERQILIKFNSEVYSLYSELQKI